MDTHAPQQRAPAMTIAECAADLRVDHLTVRRAIESGALAAFKVGRVWRIRVEDRDRWIARCTQRAPARAA